MLERRYSPIKASEPRNIVARPLLDLKVRGAPSVPSPAEVEAHLPQEHLSYDSGAKDVHSKTDRRGYCCSADAGCAKQQACIALPFLRRQVEAILSGYPTILNCSKRQEHLQN
jgi:hypothetical protein